MKRLKILSERLLTPPRTSEALGRWFVWLRWAAIGAQLVVLAIVIFWLGLEVSLPTIVALLTFAVLSNAALVVWLSRRGALPEGGFAWVMAIDVMLLTVLLQATGGPFNPFSLMYLVHITLAAVTLSRRWVWALTVLCLSCYAALFSPWLWDPHAHHMHHGAALTLHLEGMWWAMAVTAVLIVVFAMSLRSVVVEQDLELQLARESRERESRLASLGTLAAGAAHELATPLSTIAVVAKELERALMAENPTLGQDARLVHEEVARCRRVLEQLSLDAGTMMGEAPRPIRLKELTEVIMEDLEHPDRVEIHMEEGVANCSLNAPLAGLSQVIRGVLRNALQAGPGPVQFRVERQNDGLKLSILDQGVGMPPEVLARAFEPFYTTRDHGEGMGLGLYLAHRLLQDLGGSIRLDSEQDKGTLVEILIPCEEYRD